MKFVKFTVLELLSEGNSTKDTLVGATPEMIEQCIPNGTFPNASNAVLVQTESANILVDTGFFGSRLFERLQSAGVTSEQIDAVLITHMHGDHVGNLLRDGEIAFPNAKLYISQAEHDFWTDDTIINQTPENKRFHFLNAKRIMDTYRNNLILFTPENIYDEAKVQLLPGIVALTAPGHTPGHTMFRFDMRNESLLIWGDLTHALVIQMPFPQVSMTFDVNPELAAQSRKETLEYVSENNMTVVGMHILYPAMGKVELINTAPSQEQGYLFRPFSTGERVLEM